MDLNLIPLTKLRVGGAAGGRRPGSSCPHCLRHDFHRVGCIVALKLASDARQIVAESEPSLGASESAADRQQKPRQTRFVNVGPKVMQGDHCAAVACSSNMAKTIAIALNNRRDARSKTAR